jgi:hypothetical protein
MCPLSAVYFPDLPPKKESSYHIGNSNLKSGILYGGRSTISIEDKVEPIPVPLSTVVELEADKGDATSPVSMPVRRASTTAILTSGLVSGSATVRVK